MEIVHFGGRLSSTARTQQQIVVGDIVVTGIRSANSQRRPTPTL